MAGGFVAPPAFGAVLCRDEKRRPNLNKMGISLSSFTFVSFRKRQNAGAIPVSCFPNRTKDQKGMVIAMKNRIGRITTFLLVAVLAAAPPRVYADSIHPAGETIPLPLAEGEGVDNVGPKDKYVLSLEWGDLSFIYDYGRWNPNTFTYDAEQNSKNPAAGTPAGEPGWYNFDGVSNQIRVINSSKTTDINDTVDIELKVNFSIGGVSAVWYAKKDMQEEDRLADNKLVLGNDINRRPGYTDAYAYLSLEGTPLNSDGSRFQADVPTPFATVTVVVNVSE